VAPASKDDGLFESAQVWLGRRQVIVEPRDFLLEEHFRLVTLWSKRVKGVGEAVIKDSQLRDAFGWCDA